MKCQPHSATIFPLVGFSVVRNPRTFRSGRMSKVTEGDTLYVTETPDGIQLSAYDPDFETVMAAADDITRRYRNALKELAKWAR